MTRALVALFVAAMLLWIAASIVQLGGRGGDATAGVTGAARVVDGRGATREYGHGLIRFNGHGPEWWRWQLVQERKRSADLQRRLTRRVLEARGLRRTLARKPTVQEALDLACTVYGHCATLKRKAFCESRLNPRAANPTSSARGLLQFLTRGRVRRYDGASSNGGTWATTPFYAFDVYSPYANALAAGWMHANGRAGEWVCR